MPKIFHITDINNLRLIFELGFLYSKKNPNLSNLNYTNIAYSGIQDRRCSKSVPIDPKGCLHDYIPFYFCPRPPMLYAIKCGLIEGYEGSQKHIVHLVSDTDSVKEKNLPFVFTDGHAIIALSRFYNNLDHLAELDWNSIKARYWRDTYDEPDRKRKKQAEFLVKNYFPCDLILGIGVMNTIVQDQVVEILKMNNYNIKVKIKNSWYY